jgi:hypothetical protein
MEKMRLRADQKGDEGGYGYPFLQNWFGLPEPKITPGEIAGSEALLLSRE